MAFILAIRDRGTRILVICIDETELPLRLQPYQFLSVVGAADAATQITAKLEEVFAGPTPGIRRQFLNRNSEFERIEAAINDESSSVIAVVGFTGVGKASLARESIRRFYEGASNLEVEVNSGIGPAELALRLHHAAFREVLPETSRDDALRRIDESLVALAEQGRLVIIRDVQHWLADDGSPEEPLSSIIGTVAQVGPWKSRPLLVTSTRRIRLSAVHVDSLTVVSVQGLPEAHTASLISLWHELTEGTKLPQSDSLKIARQIHGHPVAAKMAANLVGQYGVRHLLEYPAEMIALRRDLAKMLIRDLQITDAAIRLMETLACIGAPVPASVLCEACGFNADVFQEAVTEATAGGLTDTIAKGELVLHPLVADHFWRSYFGREDYAGRVRPIVRVLHEYLDTLPTVSPDVVALLPVVVRLYALSGMYERARQLRWDLVGGLSQAAIIHYNRRQYDLSERFIRIVLETHSDDWRMRQYLARIHVRKDRWDEADSLIDSMLAERPRDIRMMHLRGWRHLRSGDFEKALVIFQSVLGRRPHVASFRDAADCLYRLGRSQEALSLLAQAKDVESENAFVLELEARIHEDAGNYKDALESMQWAAVREPGQWTFRHRLARIQAALGDIEGALEEETEAVRLNPEQFVARSYLVSLLFDAKRLDEASEELRTLTSLANNEQERTLLDHLRARERYFAGDTEGALVSVQEQVARRRNLAASSGFLAQIRLDQFEALPADQLAIGGIYLLQAEEALKTCVQQRDFNVAVVEALQERLKQARLLLTSLNEGQT